tara:strand:+ start:472 stop:624 length:153 start_codon:yes stop_codon:yes gene_type:complete
MENIEAGMSGNPSISLRTEKSWKTTSDGIIRDESMESKIFEVDYYESGMA